MIISETCVGLVIPVVVCLEPASLHVVVVVVVVLLLALRSCICCSFRLIDKLLLHLCLCPCVSLQNLCLGSCTFGMGLLESVSLHVVGVAVMVLLLVLRGCICCSFSLVHGVSLHLLLGCCTFGMPPSLQTCVGLVMPVVVCLESVSLHVVVVVVVVL